MADRLGRQTPTKGFLLPYKETRGQDAIDIYEESGNTAQEWQVILAYDILAVNDDGLYVHSKFGYSIPRRNGKGEVLTIRELYGLHAGEHILHTAHRTNTSSSASRRLAKLLEAAGYNEILRPKKGETYEKGYTYAKQYGLERITLLDTGGVCEFRTRTSSGGLGEGFDLLIIDEAQEYTDDQESTLKYTVSDSANPQIIMCGTPPTAVSQGTVFVHLRKDVFDGKTEDTGWAEWSIDEQSDPRDVDLWYETNPSMGTILNERKVKAEIGADVVDFNIQRLGLWLTYNQASAITAQEWNLCKVDKIPELTGKLFCGVKYGRDGNNVALSIAAKTADGKIFFECIDCRPVRNGNYWIIDFITRSDVQSVFVDGACGQNLLAEEMKRAKIKKPYLPTIKDVIDANADFERMLTAEEICHMGQTSLLNSATNVKKRPIGSYGGFGYQSTFDAYDIVLLDSVIYAIWACKNAKEAKKQYASC